MRFLFWIVFILVLIIEGTMTTLPLTLLFLLCLTVMKRQEWVFYLAFAAGILLDVFAMRTIGISSLFLVSYLFLVLLYQRKYETATMQFIILASFFGSLWYLIITGAHGVLFQAVLSSCICAAAFIWYRMSGKPSLHDGFQRV